ncbi:60S ribosomal protein L8 [Nymphaea thermarum]|nr:60S ribosomal protein L8 [Nymphaea thermarum]
MATRLPSPLAMSTTPIHSQESRLCNIEHHVGDYSVFTRTSKDYSIVTSYNPDTGTTRIARHVMGSPTISNPITKRRVTLITSSNKGLSLGEVCSIRSRSCILSRQPANAQKEPTGWREDDQEQDASQGEGPNKNPQSVPIYCNGCISEKNADLYLPYGSQRQ